LVYSVTILPTAGKQLLALISDDRAMAARMIDGLAGNPRPAGCKKLTGTELWRIRSGRLRIIYAGFDRELKILIIKVAKRREDTYRDLH